MARLDQFCAYFRAFEVVSRPCGSIFLYFSDIYLLAIQHICVPFLGTNIEIYSHSNLARAPQMSQKGVYLYITAKCLAHWSASGGVGVVASSYGKAGNLADRRHKQKDVISTNFDCKCADVIKL